MSDRIGAAEKNQRSCWKSGRYHSEQQAQQLSTTQHDKDKTPEQRKCACARQTFAVCLRSLAAARHLKPNQNTSIQFSLIVWVGAFGWAYFFFLFQCSSAARNYLQVHIHSQLFIYFLFVGHQKRRLETWISKPTRSCTAQSLYLFSIVFCCFTLFILYFCAFIASNSVELVF